MNHALRFTCLLAVVSCAGKPAPVEMPVAIVGVSGEIGPAGGTLTAPLDSALEGFVLEVPKGALTAPVTITLEPTFDATPLPVDARQIGPHVALGPSTLTFTAPVKLTLPITDSMFELFEGTPADCKVWQRKDAAWTRLEPVATAPHSITIETSSTAVAAAGIQSRAIFNVCASNPSSCEMPEPCTSSTGFCITRLPDFPTATRPFNPASISVVGGEVYYTHLANQLNYLVAYNYPQGNTVVSAPLSTGGLTVVPQRMDQAADGSIWLDFDSAGHVQFSSSMAPTQFDQGQGLSALGPVRVGSSMYRLVRSINASGLRVFKLFNDATSRTLPASTVSPLDNRPVITRRVGALQFMTRARNTGLSFFSTTSGGLDDVKVATGVNTFVKLSAVSATTGAFAVMIETGETPPQYLLDMHQDVPGTAGIDSPRRFSLGSVQITSMDYGDDNKLYAVNSSRAEVRVFDRVSGSQQTLVLSAEPVTSDAFKRMRPLVIRNFVQRKEMLLVTQGLAASPNELYAFKKNGL